MLTADRVTSHLARQGTPPDDSVKRVIITFNRRYGATKIQNRKYVSTFIYEYYKITPVPCGYSLEENLIIFSILNQQKICSQSVGSILLLHFAIKLHKIGLPVFMFSYCSAVLVLIIPAEMHSTIIPCI